MTLPTPDQQPVARSQAWCDPSSLQTYSTKTILPQVTSSP